MGFSILYFLLIIFVIIKVNNAKNKNNRVILSPAYDLVSVDIYPKKIVSHEIAMTISGKGNYMPGTGKMYEVVKYKVHGENFYYMHETFEQEDSNQRPCKVKEMLSLVPKNSEFMHIATRRL